jgi:hypothetical protein
VIEKETKKLLFLQNRGKQKIPEIQAMMAIVTAMDFMRVDIIF